MHPEIPFINGLAFSEGYYCGVCEKVYSSVNNFKKHKCRGSRVAFQYRRYFKFSNEGFKVLRDEDDLSDVLTEQELIALDRVIEGGGTSTSGTTPILRKTMFHLVLKGRFWYKHISTLTQLLDYDNEIIDDLRMTPKAGAWDRNEFDQLRQCLVAFGKRNND